jgi:hypothetical protein
MPNVVDQISVMPNFGIGISESQYHKAVAQTFTVGQTGILTQIGMMIAEQIANSTGDLSVDVRPVQNGIPGPDSSCLLKLVVPSGMLPDTNSNEWISIDLLSDTPIAVKAGDQLAVVLAAIGGGYYGASGFSSPNTDGYPGGEAYWRHDQYTNGQWVTLAAQEKTKWIDLFFCTRVTT